MKKFLALTLSLAMALSLAACGGTGNNTAGRLVERRRDFRNGCGAAAGLFVDGTKQHKRSEDQQKGQNADDGFD